ncbi:MAG: hypothetical protein AB7H90_20425 [Alphaproteobacteria bacterium]
MSLVEQWRVDGFVFPEAALVLPGGNVVVSDRGEDGPAADGRIALIQADGSVISMNWVTGLVNPFGMAAANGRLYVVDGAVGLQVVDIASGRLLEPIPLPDARSPNDITAGPGGSLYVTDTAAGEVIQVRHGVASWLARPGSVPAVNDIVWSGDQIVVGTIGEGLDLSDFSVQSPGGLFAVDPASGAVREIAATHRSASVDGVASLDGMIVYDDNPTGRILALGEDGVLEIGTTAPEAGALSGSGNLLSYHRFDRGMWRLIGSTDRARSDKSAVRARPLVFVKRHGSRKASGRYRDSHGNGNQNGMVEYSEYRGQESPLPDYDRA